MNENTFKINKSHIKILDTIKYFEDNKLFVNADCIFNVLIGNDKDLDELCVSSPTYMSLVSISSRKLKSKLKMLQRYSFIEYKYSRNYNEPFFKLSNSGKTFLLTYHETHKTNYKKRRVVNNKINYINCDDPSIIKL